MLIALVFDTADHAFPPSIDLAAGHCPDGWRCHAPGVLAMDAITRSSTPPAIHFCKE